MSVPAIYFVYRADSMIGDKPASAIWYGEQTSEQKEIPVRFKREITAEQAAGGLTALEKIYPWPECVSPDFKDPDFKKAKAEDIIRKELFDLVPKWKEKLAELHKKKEELTNQKYEIEEKLNSLDANIFHLSRMIDGAKMITDEALWSQSI